MTQNTSENGRLRGLPRDPRSAPRCARFVQLSLRCTLLVTLALAALGCDPASHPRPVTDDAGTTISGVRLFVAVRVAVAGEPWELFEPPTVGSDLRLEKLSLAVAGARSPSDRVDLAVPESEGPILLELVGGPRDVELLGASPATYGGATLQVAPPEPGAPSIELRFVQGAVTYLVESTQRLTLDTRCRGAAAQVDPNMLGTLLLTLPVEPLAELLAELEPVASGTVVIDATTSPDVLAQFDEVLRAAWELDCSAALEDPPGALVEEPVEPP
jgi:hypothetical protein